MKFKYFVIVLFLIAISALLGSFYELGKVSWYKNDNSLKIYTFVPVLASFACLWLAYRCSTQRLGTSFTRALPVLKTLIWLFLACVAPLCYVPETKFLVWPMKDPDETAPAGAVSSGSSLFTAAIPPSIKTKPLAKKKNKKKTPMYKDKITETSGSQSKKIRADASWYAGTRERILRQRREIIARLKGLILTFKAKRHRIQISILSKSKLMKQSVRDVRRLRRELVVLENMVSVLQVRLETHKGQNKQLVQHYQKIHQQLQKLCRPLD